MYQLARTDKEIDDTVSKAVESSHDIRWAGMTYEQGVIAAIEWLTGEKDHNPMDD